jgi:hypothetical protein
MPGAPDPADSLSTTIVGVSVMFTALTVICLGFRLTSRTISDIGWKLDDYFAICATIGLIGILVCVGLMANNGIGRHVTWLIEHPESIVTLGKTTLAFSYVYPATQVFAKISALELLKRIFTLNQRFIRWGYYFLYVYVILVWIAGVLMVSLECQPFSTNWGEPYQCQYNAAASLSLNILIATTDLFLIILPQPSIWQLKLNLGRRFGLSLIFMIGLLALIVSIVRMVFVYEFQSSLDSTYHESIPVVFTIVEPACFIICGCLPSMPRCFHPMRQWNGWSKLSSLVSSRTGNSSRVSLSQGTSKNSIMATKSWHVLHGGDGTSVSAKESRSPYTESTERLELNDFQGARTAYVSGGEVRL